MFEFTHTSGLAMLYWLVVGHWFADYVFQSDFMSEAKNPTTSRGKVFWKHVLPAHAGIHGAFVTLVTGSYPLGIMETVIHAITDHAKCQGKITLNQDQYIHFGCKVLWVMVLFKVGF